VTIIKDARRKSKDEMERVYCAVQAELLTIREVHIPFKKFIYNL
jgi:hypothetical protein